MRVVHLKGGSKMKMKIRMLVLSCLALVLVLGLGTLFSGCSNKPSSKLSSNLPSNLYSKNNYPIYTENYLFKHAKVRKKLRAVCIKVGKIANTLKNERKIMALSLSNIGEDCSNIAYVDDVNHPNG